MAHVQMAQNWSPGILTTTGQFGHTAQYGLQAGLQMQYEAVPMPMAMQEMQMMQVPLQEMQTMQIPIQEMQMMQMPMQEIFMIPMQMPAQEVAFFPSAPALRNHAPSPEQGDRERETHERVKNDSERERRMNESDDQPVVEYINKDIYKIIEVPKPEICIVEVPVEVEHRVQRVREVPVDKLIVKNVKTVQKKIDVERCIWKEIPIEKVVEVKVPVTIEKVVEQEKIVYKDKVILKEVLLKHEIEPEEPVRERAAPPAPPQDVTKVVDVPVTIQNIKEKIIEIPVEQIVEIPFDRIIEVPVDRVVQVPKEFFVDTYIEVPIEQIIERPVDRVIERMVERVIERTLEVPVEVLRERMVEVPVERIVEKIVYVETEPVFETRTRVVQVPTMVMQEQVIEEQVEVGTRARTVSPRVYDQNQTYASYDVARYERSPPTVNYERQPVIASYQSTDYAQPPRRPSVEYGQIRRPSQEFVQIRRLSQESIRTPRQATPTYVQSRSPVEYPSLRSVGVGLALERRDGDTATYVERIVPGFAADLSGQFQVGDVLTAVDNTFVEGYSLDAIKNLTIGAEGSNVTLRIFRNGETRSITVQRVFPAGN